MLTIEKFYFSHKEAASHITGGGNSLDYSITFVGSEEDGAVNITIRVRGKEEFRKVIQQIYDIGIGLVSLPSQVKRNDEAQSGEQPEAVQTKQASLEGPGE